MLFVILPKNPSILIFDKGNKIENTKKKAKLSSNELRKKKKERMVSSIHNPLDMIQADSIPQARRKRGS